MTTQTQHAGPDERSELIERIRFETQAMRNAVAGKHTDGTFHALNWSDKPHRVLYDACSLLDKAAALLAEDKGGEVVALRQENELLRTALRFYANGDHYHLDASEEFDTVSGEPQSWLCSGVEDSETMVENGEVARYTLMGQVIGWEDAEEDHTPQPIEGEAPFFAAALFTAYNTHPQQQAAQAAVPQGLVLVQGYERLIDQYIEEYEFTDGDSGYHDPSEFEQAMIKDAFMGFDFSSLFCAVPAPVEQKGEAHAPQ